MRALLAPASLALIAVASCTDEDWGGEHHAVGTLSITVTGAGSLSVRTWNASSTCTSDEGADATSTTCTFPIEDDAAEVVLVPLDPVGTVDFHVSACARPAPDDALETRAAGIALRPRDVLLGVACPSYPVRIDVAFGEAPPDDAGGDAPDDAADSGG